MFHVVSINHSVFPQGKNNSALLGSPFAYFNSYPLKLVGSLSLKLWQIVYLSWILKSKWYLRMDSRTLGNTLLSPFDRRRN